MWNVVVLHIHHTISNRAIVQQRCGVSVRNNLLRAVAVSSRTHVATSVVVLHPKSKDGSQFTIRLNFIPPPSCTCLSRAKSLQLLQLAKLETLSGRFDDNWWDRRPARAVADDSRGSRCTPTRRSNGIIFHPSSCCLFRSVCRERCYLQTHMCQKPYEHKCVLASSTS